jgi:phage protein D
MSSVITSSSRRPRGLVKVNGELLPGWIHFSVTNNNYASADSFSCEFAASRLPASRNLNWFSAQQVMYVELFIGFLQDASSGELSHLTRWIYGRVDEIDIDIIEQTVTVSGRDLTQVFLDAKTTDKFQNKTSSQIVALLAARHNLTPVVTATRTLAGKFYEIDHVNMHDEQSEWDLLQYLAAREQFRVWVRGTTVYFMPPPDPATTIPYEFVYIPPSPSQGSPAGNFWALKFKRALTVSAGVKVVIHSWNKKQAKGFTVTFPVPVKPAKPVTDKPLGDPRTYERTIANLTQDQALARAKSLHDQIMAHEMKIEDLELPGDNVLDITALIRFSGTGTQFDQLYYPDSVTRSITFDGGYTMSVSAKNHAPQLEA